MERFEVKSYGPSNCVYYGVWDFDIGNWVVQSIDQYGQALAVRDSLLRFHNITPTYDY